MFGMTKAEKQAFAHDAAWDWRREAKRMLFAGDTAGHDWANNLAKSACERAGLSEAATAQLLRS